MRSALNEILEKRSRQAVVYDPFTRLDRIVHLTVLLLEFIENYHVEEAENDLTQLANKVAVILENHEDQALARSITWELADNLTSIAIIQDEKNHWYSPNDKNRLSSITVEQIQHDKDLNKALKDHKK